MSGVITTYWTILLGQAGGLKLAAGRGTHLTQATLRGLSPALSGVMVELSADGARDAGLQALAVAAIRLESVIQGEHDLVKAKRALVSVDRALRRINPNQLKQAAHRVYHRTLNVDRFADPPGGIARSVESILERQPAEKSEGRFEDLLEMMQQDSMISPLLGKQYFGRGRRKQDLYDRLAQIAVDHFGRDEAIFEKAMDYLMAAFIHPDGPSILTSQAVDRLAEKHPTIFSRKHIDLLEGALKKMDDQLAQRRGDQSEIKFHRDLIWVVIQSLRKSRPDLVEPAVAAK